MQKTPSFLTRALGLGAITLFGSLSAEAAQQPATSRASQRASTALGLSRSVIGDVQMRTSLTGQVTVGINLPGSPIFLSLHPHSVRAENFEARAQQADGSWIVMPTEPVRTYQGIVLSEPDSLVAASILEDGVHARVRLANGQEYWIEPLAPHSPEATSSEHVLYLGTDVNATGMTCDADLMTPVSVPSDPSGPTNEYAGTGSVTAQLACDADFEYFSDHGAGTQARIESVISAMNLQYSSEVGITHEITTILIRTSSNDPYTKKPAEQLLNELRSEWNSNQTGVVRDVVQLFTGRNLAGSTIGIAYIGVVCNLNVAYSLVESDFNSNFACVTDLSAHELGHNWNANHCSCSGFTMNASITCANTFNPSGTRPAITAYRDSQSCFGAPAATGSIAGTVTNAADGQPIGGASVQVSSGQSSTTAGDGSYSISGVPTGSRTVTASAVGFDAQNSGATVSENQTTTVDFSLNAAPVGSQAIVDCVTYRSSGGQNSDRHLFIDVTIVNDAGNPVSGASVSVAVTLDGGAFGTASATTDSSGLVTFQAKNSPNGCFEVDVTSVSAAGLTFDGTEPLNGFAKGSDSSPDADCRSGSDGCGAG